MLVVAVQVAMIYQELKTGKSVELIDVNLSVTLLLLAGYAPKLAETLADIIKLKFTK
jgi:hypothetical protein